MNEYMNTALFTILTFPTREVNVCLIYLSVSYHGKEYHCPSDLLETENYRVGVMRQHVTNKLTMKLRLPDYRCTLGRWALLLFR